MAEELRVEFHRDLVLIDRRVRRLFALVADAVGACTEAILSSDRTTARAVAERDELVDTVYLEVEALVNEAFARNAPVAGDLRFLLSVLRIVPELERSHDLAEHIARRGVYGLAGDLTPRIRGVVARMGDVASDMWRQSARAWAERDATLVEGLEILDDEMDELHTVARAELGSGKMPVAVVMEMTLVARFYERLGDHAVNIARRVVYLAGRVTPEPPVS